MSKVAVVFWSGTGNTGIMATKVAEGVTEAGGEATILPADQFNAEMMDSYDAIVLQWELNSLKKVNLNQCLWNVNLS
jgi:flavodoxin